MKIGFYIFFCMILCLYSCAYKSGVRNNQQNSAHNQSVGPVLRTNLNLLFGAKWELFEIKGKVIDTRLSGQPFLKFESNDHKAFGKGGCNSFSVRYDIMDDSIRFSDILSTKMACDNLPLEEEFFKVLSNSGYLLIKKDTLQLLDNSRILARFKRVIESK